MKIVELLAIPIGFALVKSITKNIKDEPAPKDIIPKQEGFTLGPAGPAITDFKIIPESFTQGQNQGSGLTFSPITIKTLESFDPTKKVTVPKYDPTLPIAKPIKEGKIKKFGTGFNFGI